MKILCRFIKIVLLAINASDLLAAPSTYQQQNQKAHRLSKKQKIIVGAVLGGFFAGILLIYLLCRNKATDKNEDEENMDTPVQDNQGAEFAFSRNDQKVSPQSGAIKFAGIDKDSGLYIQDV